MLKTVIRYTLIYFIVAAAFSGSVYNLINANSFAELVKYSIFNLIIFALAFPIAYFGVKVDMKKGKKF